mmetsp:Transcript_20809/g.65427  ORF Transcript_20809/g.65427 Transcript_20809/m.65427 type:complete len:252 (-) Transcript_20809:183-938(-)
MKEGFLLRRSLAMCVGDPRAYTQGGEAAARGGGHEDRPTVQGGVSRQKRERTERAGWLEGDRALSCVASGVSGRGLVGGPGLDDADLRGAEDTIADGEAGLEDLGDGGWLVVGVVDFEEGLVEVWVELVADPAKLDDAVLAESLDELRLGEVDAVDECLERGVVVPGGVERVAERVRDLEHRLGEFLDRVVSRVLHVLVLNSSHVLHLRERAHPLVLELVALRQRRRHALLTLVRLLRRLARAPLLGTLLP